MDAVPKAHGAMSAAAEPHPSDRVEIDWLCRGWVRVGVVKGVGSLTGDAGEHGDNVWRLGPGGGGGSLSTDVRVLERGMG